MSSTGGNRHPVREVCGALSPGGSCDWHVPVCKWKKNTKMKRRKECSPRSPSIYRKRLSRESNKVRGKLAIDDIEDGLASWAQRDIKGNLCYELGRLHSKYNNYRRSALGHYRQHSESPFCKRCMFGMKIKIVLKSFSAETLGGDLAGDLQQCPVLEPV